MAAVAAAAAVISYRHACELVTTHGETRLRNQSGLLHRPPARTPGSWSALEDVVQENDELVGAVAGAVAGAVIFGNPIGPAQDAGNTAILAESRSAARRRLAGLATAPHPDSFS